MSQSYTSFSHKDDISVHSSEEIHSVVTTAQVREDRMDSQSKSEDHTSKIVSPTNNITTNSSDNTSTMITPMITEYMRMKSETEGILPYTLIVDGTVILSSFYLRTLPQCDSIIFY